MWPTQVSGSTAPNPWSERRLRSRALAIAGVAGLMVFAAVAAWLSSRGGQPATPPLYGTASSAPAALWTWDGTSYAQHTVPANGPSSNHADMAFDRTHGVIVLWDHGCASMVMGFQGGCVTQVNRTWTWDGSVWTAHRTQSSPPVAGPGAMLFDRKLGQVVYVNAAGRAWTWGSSDWESLALPSGPAIQSPTLAAGYDEGRDLLVLVSSTATWLWDGSSWKTAPGGIDPGEARGDAHLVYDRAHQQLVYVGTRATWTWDGSQWQQHAQPGISSETNGIRRSPRRDGPVRQRKLAAGGTRFHKSYVWFAQFHTTKLRVIVGGP